MILVVNKRGMRLCQDSKFRDFANFGTFPFCVKVYKQAGRAINLAAHLTAVAQHKGNGNEFMAVKIPEGATVDACGEVMVDKPHPDRPGWVMVERHALSEYKLERKL